MQNLRIKKLETGKIYINGDEELLAKIEGEDLSGIDVSDLDLNSATLAQQFNEALSKPGPVTVVDGICNYEYHEAKRYAVLKEKIIAQHRPKRMRIYQTFEGNGDSTITFERPAEKITIINDSNVNLTFTIEGMSGFMLKPGEVFDEEINPTSILQITGTGTFRGYVRRYE